MLKIEKLFFGSLIAFSLIVGGLLYRIFTVLNNYESVETVQFTYHDFGSFVTYGVPVTYLVLLILANFIFMKSGKSRYFAWSFFFFAVFTIVDYVFAGEAYFHFTKEAGLWKGGFSVTGFAGLFLCFVAFIVTMTNYLICNTIKKIKTR